MSAGNVYEEMARNAGGYAHAHGTTVPADGTAGYLPGCIFAHTDGVVEQQLYINEGTAASCDFNVLMSQERFLTQARTFAAPITAASSVIRDNQEYFFNTFRVGATAGWVITGVNKANATLPASQTAATLVIPISGLKLGNTITRMGIVGQIESAGGAVTVDFQLRKLTAAVADLVDAQIVAGTQVAVTADTALTYADTITALEYVVAEGESYYVLITATTAGSTDIDLMGVELIVTET